MGRCRLLVVVAVVVCWQGVWVLLGVSSKVAGCSLACDHQVLAGIRQRQLQRHWLR
jgi:hypothetical protein